MERRNRQSTRGPLLPTWVSLALFLLGSVLLVAASFATWTLNGSGGAFAAEPHWAISAAGLLLIAVSWYLLGNLPKLPPAAADLRWSAAWSNVASSLHQRHP